MKRRFPLRKAVLMGFISVFFCSAILVIFQGRMTMRRDATTSGVHTRLPATHERKQIFVTGCAGFIGSHLSLSLLRRGDSVTCIDNFDSSLYPSYLKKNNLKMLETYKNFRFFEEDFTKTKMVGEAVPPFDVVVHMGGLAGVRTSVEQAERYMEVNVVGTTSLLQQIRPRQVKKNPLSNEKDYSGLSPHFVYASSSSVYGLNTILPFAENHTTDKINSPYAASKKMMEIAVDTFCRLHQISAVGLRFFTVFGPRGRPDMAPFIFLKNIHKGESIHLSGGLDDTRDFTFISDVVRGILEAIDLVPVPGIHRIYNIGNSHPVSLRNFIAACGEVVGKQPIVTNVGRRKGDVPHTYAEISKARIELGFNPRVSLKSGLEQTYEWMLKTVLNETFVEIESKV